MEKVGRAGDEFEEGLRAGRGSQRVMRAPGKWSL